MLKTYKKLLPYAVGVGALLLVSYFCLYVGSHIESFGLLENSEYRVLITNSLSALRNIIQVSLLVAWCVSLQNRLVHKSIKNLMLGVGIMMVLWVIVRTVKWEFVVSYEEPLVRYLWYCFYIPMLLIPLLGVYIVHLIGKPEGYKLPKALYLLLIPASVLITVIFTNDYHRLVFDFPNGIKYINEDYTYNFMFFIVCGWFVILGLYFVLMLVKKSHSPGNKAFKSLPLIIMIISIIFWIAYALGVIESDLTTVDCLMITLLLESAIQVGLIPSNSNYDEIFNSTTVPVMIVNEEYAPQYSSETVSEIATDEMKKAENGVLNCGNILLHSQSIKAGHVLWQDDITVLNELKEQFQDTILQLDEENDMLQAEIEVKENRTKLDEKNRLYDRIAQEVEPQLVKVAELLKEIDENSEATPELLSKVCVIGSYIKRRGNLLLLAEENPQIDARELEYCIRESLDNLHLGGVFTSFESECNGTVNAECIVAVYDFYETLAEKLMNNITAMLVRLNCNEGSVKMNVQMGCLEDIAKQVLDGVQMPLGSFVYDIDDEDISITLTITDGGAVE